MQPFLSLHWRIQFRTDHLCAFHLSPCETQRAQVVKLALKLFYASRLTNYQNHFDEVFLELLGF